MNPDIARIRAILGGVFAVLGILIAARILLSPSPFSQKLLGLAFAVVLVGLGAVRIRNYLIVMRMPPP